jgi:hypothetical protein
MPALFYCNPLFDLTLGGFDTGSLRRATDEMWCYMIPCAGTQDALVMKAAVQPEYAAYLESCKIACPHFVTEHDRYDGFTGVAWGWNEDAVRLFRSAHADWRAPDLSVVRKVNSRAFCHVVQRSIGCGVSGSVYCATEQELVTALRPMARFPVVIKPDHGNAGYGFIIKKTREWSAGDSEKVRPLFTSGHGVVIEPWCDRIADIATICFITAQGEVRDVRHYRPLCNKSGTTYSDFIDPRDQVIAPWRDYLHDKACAAAHSVAKEGYFGPAGFDSFLMRDEGGCERCAAIIEINARFTLGHIAFALHDSLAGEQVSLYRFIGRRRHALPETYPSLIEKLGDDAWDSDTNRGIMLLTPLRLSQGRGIWIQPSRSIFYLVAENSDRLFLMDERLRTLFNS